MDGAARRRYGRELGVILLDMDGLKQVNDGDGHAAGDRALVSDRRGALATTSASPTSPRASPATNSWCLCPETAGEGLRRLGH